MLPEFIIEWFDGFMHRVAERVRIIMQEVAKRFPELRVIVDRESDRRKRTRQLTYRKKKSQAKKWRKWKRRTRSGKRSDL
ncbi:hypothetical protein KDJ56_11015 [Brevibacillus composti]|uniref:Uncharacterized protein n=1 Tax=Brevibacillus composti TaxID=2796470 RepID=A0ABX7Z8J4_9BACL|nr:hypothetical protein [Brevibacillus composti]QUO43431.1 hypothetical protein KDJ56_11015 [Brevibacillus composti]